MWLSGHGIEAGKLAPIVGMSVCVAAINTSLGLATATVVETDPRAIILLVTPVLAVFLAYRAHLAERRQAANLQFLHEASRTLSAASNTQAGIAGLLAMTLENFRGEVAEVCLFPAEGEGAGSRISVGGPHGLEVMKPLDEHVVRELTELMGRDSAARLVTPEEVGGALAGHLERLGVHSAMLASLPGVRRAIGTVMVADRTGYGGLFGASEIKLFDTLAHQTGAAVGQNSLTTKVDELRELQVELEHKAFHDPLTGLANRLLFMNRVEHALKRRTGNAAVIYVDLDNFKPINDTHGHEVGDAVLIGAAQRLRASLRPADTAARLGGDEFAVLLVDIPEEHIGVVADRIAGNLTRPLELAAGELAVGASLGVASAASGSLDAESLVRNADVAMYVAKHGGKGRLSVFERPRPSRPRGSRRHRRAGRARRRRCSSAPTRARDRRARAARSPGARRCPARATLTPAAPSERTTSAVGWPSTVNVTIAERSSPRSWTVTPASADSRSRSSSASA